MKRLVLLMVSFMMVFNLFGCKALKTNYELESFKYSYHGSMENRNYDYIVRKNGNDFEFVYELDGSKYGTLSCKLTSEEADTLAQICKKHQIGKWNGYDKVNKHVLDGDGFSLDVKFADGSMSAHGSNAAPSGYGDFSKEMYQFFKPLVEKLTAIAREEYIKQDFNGNLDSVMFSFSPAGYPKTYDFFLHVYLNDDGSQHLYYQLKSKDDGIFPAGEYSFGADVEKDTVDMTKIKQLIDSYEIKNWDGIEQGGDNKEWYQVDFVYDDGLVIASCGTKTLENYEAFRNALVEILFNLVTKG